LANPLKHFGLQQRWIVFSPMPMQDDGWLEVHVSSSTAPKQGLLVPTLKPLSGTGNPFLTTRVYRTQRASMRPPGPTSATSAGNCRPQPNPAPWS
jgi:hypothetical protein